MKTLWQIMQGKTVQIPVYDFFTHSRWAPRCCSVHTPGAGGGGCTTKQDQANSPKYLILNWTWSNLTQQPKSHIQNVAFLMKQEINSYISGLAGCCLMVYPSTRVCILTITVHVSNPSVLICQVQVVPTENSHVEQVPVVCFNIALLGIKNHMLVSNRMFS